MPFNEKAWLKAWGAFVIFIALAWLLFLALVAAVVIKALL